MENTEKKSTKFWNGPWGTILLFIILFIVIGSLLTAVYLVVITPFKEKLSPEWDTLLTEYFPTALTGLTFFIFMALKDKESLATMSPRYGKNNLKNAFFGVIAGFVCNSVLALIAMAAGSIRVSFKGMGIGLAIIAFIFVALQSVSEEIVVRVFLYQRLNRSNGALFAIIMSAVVFSVLHISNLISYKVQPLYSVLALINIMLVAVFLAETVYFGKNVWFAFAFHSSWNFCQNYFFGLPNSGRLVTASIFGLDNKPGTDSLFYSSTFGIEAALSSTIIYVVLIAALYLINKKKASVED